MTGGWTDPDDRLLARAVFGTDDLQAARRMIADWIAAAGLGPAEATAIDLSVGAAVTLARPDGSKLFAKIWPRDTDARTLAAQMDVQRGMGASGFPAPDVLAGPAPLGPGWAVAMTYDRAGVPTDARRRAVREAMAEGLARFVAEAEAFRDLDGLPRRALPAEGALWPRPHSPLFDFAATRAGAEWIDAIAEDALVAMRASESRLVVGHCDWSAKNMRMGEGGLAVVYDWDSVFVEREAFVLGAAAANFPMTSELDVPETPEIADVAAFVRDYERARGAPFTQAEIAAIEAGATYARAYKARCEHAIDREGACWAGSSRESLQINGPFRFWRV